MTLDQIIQIAVGVGTIAVAILAIWGDQIRHRLGLGPRLTLLLDDPLGELIDISEGTGIRTPARYYHLRVRNSHGWSQATNVRVVITGLAKPAADGSMVPQPLSGPLQLMWRFSSYHPSYSIVGPDDICDLGFLKRGQNFVLTPYVFPNNFAGSLGGNQRMQVVSRQLPTTPSHRSSALRSRGMVSGLMTPLKWRSTWLSNKLRLQPLSKMAKIDERAAQHRLQADSGFAARESGAFC